MVQRRELFRTILVTSLGVWLMLMLTLFLPTTGLLSRSPSDGVDQTLLNLFLLSGAVASTACFVTGLEKLEVKSKVLGMRAVTIPPLMNPTEQAQTGEILEQQTQTGEILEQQTQTGEILEQDWTWKHEQYRVKGELRSVFRDVKSGRFSKDPIEPDGMRKLLGVAKSIYPSGYTVRATGNPHRDCITISYDRAKRYSREEEVQKRRTRSRRGNVDEREEG
jgi:hypothetical protein